MGNNFKFIPLLLLVVTWLSASNNDLMKLTKVNHHTDTTHRPSIEKGVISFYFSKEPAIQLSERAMPDKKKIARTFTINNVLLADSKIENDLQQLLNFESEWYSIAVKQYPVDKKVTFIITYNPELVRLSWSSFDALKQEKGFMVQLYDIALINKIQSKEAPIIEITQSNKRGPVIIDCGHGGNDSGALSYDGKLSEKDLCLWVGKETEKLLQNKGIKVFLTRENDQFVSLEQRTAFSNAQDAKLLISIHANAANNAFAQGIESFYFTSTLLRVTGTDMPDKALHCIQAIKNTQSMQSHHLAKQLQLNTLKQTKSMFNVRDRKVKPAVGQLFIGTFQLPAALIEIGFLTNCQESTMLKEIGYQKKIAEGIASGIMNYLDCDSYISYFFSKVAPSFVLNA